MSADLAFLSATDALARFRARELSPVELTKAVIDRAAAVEGTVNAFALTFFEEALAAARAAEARYAPGSSETPRALEGELKPPRLVPRVPRTVPVGLPGTLVRRRPDVREAEAHLHAATAQTGVAVANFYPSVTLTGALNLQAIRFGDLAKLSSTAWNVGPSVTVPIFEGGRLKGQLELRESQQREAAVQFQKTVLQAWQQVDDALTAYAQAQRRRADLARAVGQNEAALAASRQRYREGLVDFLNVNQAEVQLLSSQTDFADAETQIATDLVQLYRALGGGWDVVDGPGAFDHPAAVGPPGAIPTLIDAAVR